MTTPEPLGAIGSRDGAESREAESLDAELDAILTEVKQDEASTPRGIPEAAARAFAAIPVDLDDEAQPESKTPVVEVTDEARAAAAYARPPARDDKTPPPDPQEAEFLRRLVLPPGATPARGTPVASLAESRPPAPPVEERTAVTPMAPRTAMVDEPVTDKHTPPTAVVRPQPTGERARRASQAVMTIAQKRLQLSVGHVAIIVVVACAGGGLLIAGLRGSPAATPPPNATTDEPAERGKPPARPRKRIVQKAAEKPSEPDRATPALTQTSTIVPIPSEPALAPKAESAPAPEVTRVRPASRPAPRSAPRAADRVSEKPIAKVADKAPASKPATKAVAASPAPAKSAGKQASKKVAQGWVDPFGQ
jgi:hypothetical protein